MRPFARLVLIALIASGGAFAQDGDFAALTEGATVSEGAVTHYERGGRHLIALPQAALSRTLMWHAEISRFPPGAIAMLGNVIASDLVELERRGDRLLVRRLSVAEARPEPEPHYTGGAGKMRPVDLAVGNANLAPVVLALPILAEGPGGALLMDVTDVFGTDIPGLSAAGQLLGAGLAGPIADPSRSFLVEFDTYPENVHFRTQVTFAGVNAQGAQDAATIEVAHTLALLPEAPMERRRWDPRVGYFGTEVPQLGLGDAGTRTLRLALRHRLEHADPEAPRPSPPLDPLVFWLAPEIPERWRPYIRAGIEDWQGAFEGAGFSGAIVARDAPSPEEDPTWSAEDSRLNVVRWLAQPHANAMGPNIHDPRTGEIVGAHILIWPEVLTFFGSYYHLTMSRLDPDAASIPLPEETLGRLLRYALSHEVGHSLGLRHNHRASTAWTTEQLRDPAFMAEHGPTPSIMAYGRWNYVARPGDGVGVEIPVISEYDRRAIAWGYADVDAAALEALARPDGPETIWGAGELPEEFLGRYDPMIATESIGADRIESARAGLAALAASLGRLPGSVAGADDPQGTGEALLAQAQLHFSAFAEGPAKMIGGIVEGAAPGEPAAHVPPGDQAAAGAFLVTEAVDALGMFTRPDLLARYRPVGGIVIAEGLAEALVVSALKPDRLRLVHMQGTLDPEGGWGVPEYLASLTDALVAEPVPIEEMTPVRRAALAAYVGLLNGLPAYPGSAETEAELLGAGVPPGIAAVIGADLSDTGLADAAAAEIARLTAAFAPEERHGWGAALLGLLFDDGRTDAATGGNQTE